MEQSLLSEDNVKLQKELSTLQEKIQLCNQQTKRDQKQILSFQHDLYSETKGRNDITNAHVELLALFELEKTKNQSLKARIRILQDEFSKNKQHILMLLEKSDKDDQLIQYLQQYVVHGRKEREE